MSGTATVFLYLMRYVRIQLLPFLEDQLLSRVPSDSQAGGLGPLRLNLKLSHPDQRIIRDTYRSTHPDGAHPVSKANESRSGPDLDSSFILFLDNPLAVPKVIRLIFSGVLLELRCLNVSSNLPLYGTATCHFSPIDFGLTSVHQSLCAPMALSHHITSVALP